MDCSVKVTWSAYVVDLFTYVFNNFWHLVVVIKKHSSTASSNCFSIECCQIFIEVISLKLSDNLSKNNINNVLVIFFLVIIHLVYCIVLKYFEMYHNCPN